MALVKYNNNSISAITAASSLPTGAMTLIKEQTASSDSTISFVDGTSDVVLDNTYPIYKFVFTNVHPANDNVVLHFQGNAAGGSGYNETITSTTFLSSHYENGTNGQVSYNASHDQAQGTAFQRLAEGIGNGSDEACSGYLWLFSPSSTTYVKHFIAETNYLHASDRSYNLFIAGYFNTTSAIDEIQFKMDGGNIDAGTFKLYGIKDS